MKNVEFNTVNGTTSCFVPSEDRPGVRTNVGYIKRRYSKINGGSWNRDHYYVKTRTGSGRVVEAAFPSLPKAKKFVTKVR